MSEPSPDILVVREHLLRHLGPPEDVLELSGGQSPSIPRLEVAFFAPGGPDSPVVFVTCGASDVLMNDGRRVEGLFMMRPRPNLQQAEIVVRLLGAFAMYADRQGVTLGPGDVIPARAELAPLCRMDAVVFVPPLSFVESFQRFEARDRKVEILWMLPVYQEEATYSLEHGPRALMTLFAAHEMDLTQLDREPANTTLSPQDAMELAAAREKARAEQAQAEKAKPVLPSAPRKGLAPRGSDAIIEEDADGFVVQVKPPKPKAPKAPKPAPVIIPEAPAKPAPKAKPAPPAKKQTQKFDLNRGKTATFVPRDDTRGEPEPPPPPPPPPEESPQDAKKKKVEALKAAAKERAAKAKKEE